MTVRRRPTKRELVRAIRARLNLDLGLGVEYISRKSAATCEALAAAAGVVAAQTSAPSPESRSAIPASAVPASSSVSSPSSAPAWRSPAAAPSVRPPVPAHEAASSGSSDAPTRALAASLTPPVEPPSHPEKEGALAALREEAMRCRACELCAKRSTVVWGEGNLAADIMFIGEAPGRDEDLEGRPFVGRSGRLLTDIIEKGMKIPRSMVYITNVVKCRPPGNRDPKPDETTACFRYLERQIAVIAPKLIVAVGGVAGCHLLGLPPKSPGLRGVWRQFGDIPLRVIYHPSYLLRQRGSAQSGEHTRADRDTWEDVKAILERLALVCNS